MIVDNESGLLLMRNDQLGERQWRSDDCYKVIFSPYGKGIYQTIDGDQSIDRGAFFIFNPKDEHKQLQAYHEKFLIEIQPSFLMEAAEKIGIGHQAPEYARVSYRHPQIQQWMTFVREFIITQESEESHQLFLDHSLTQLAILMLEYGAGSHQTSFPSIHIKGPVNEVMNALKESYREEWTLDQMAEAAGMNKFQVAHLFKEETGVSPYSWIQLYRLFRSQHSLLHTAEPILTIALQHGFTNVSSYNQLFKKVYRKTPTEFRRLHRFHK
ncbi:AraC family transcriptional regulator [Halobacillus andaensis]|nr:AraC family transcriptional regulator [Halobacillus andaensis]MBP2003929.1 AraC-like DNA-binding protein [Halobacillus andaensis]